MRGPTEKWKAKFCFWEKLTICPFLFIIGIVSQHSTVNFCFHFVKPNIGILEFVPGRMGAEGVTSDGSNINIMGVNKQRPGRTESYPLSSLGEGILNHIQSSAVMSCPPPTITHKTHKAQDHKEIDISANNIKSTPPVNAVKCKNRTLNQIISEINRC